MSDPFLAYIDKAEADFRAALENLTRARKVYSSFLALRERASQAAADSRSEPSPPAEQSVNALPLSGREAVMSMGEGGRVGTIPETPDLGKQTPADSGVQDGGHTLVAQPAAAVDSDPGPIPVFLDRRQRAPA